MAPMHLLELPEDLLCRIFAATANGACVSRCERTCIAMWRLSLRARELWRVLLTLAYGLPPQVCGAECDTRAVFQYIAREEKHGEQKLIPAVVLFSDDGIPFPGHGPGKAMPHHFSNPMACWCTNEGVNRNVDLVVSFVPTMDSAAITERVTQLPKNHSQDGKRAEIPRMPYLVTDFTVVNPGEGFSNPMHKVLAWASIMPPDLEASKIWDLTTEEQSTDETNSQRGSPEAPTVAVFPPYPTCRNSAVTVPCSQDGKKRAVVAYFAHFKLLNSFDDEGHHGDTANIDAKGLYAQGKALPQLETFLGSTVDVGDDPSYEVRHKGRLNYGEMFDFQVQQQYLELMAQ